jgi:Ca2+/Na+ antiporter
MKFILYITAGPMFLISFSAYLYLSHKLKAGYNRDLEDYYHEVEDQHPGLARYNKWTRISFAVVVVSVLLLFIAAYI